MTALRLALVAILSAPPSPPLVRAVAVPRALSALTTNPEFSDLVWSAALSRYLIVSDDTGSHELGTTHAPLVLGLDATGKLDGEPIAIAGVESLNDPEAMCQGPEGSFFLATSHSPDRKGRTPKERRQLLQLKLNGRAMTVVGTLDLATLPVGSLLELAGLPPSGRLDIEALAYREGSLFIGLKSPLTSSGAAVVLRLTNPVAAIHEGRVPERGLSRWAELPLCLDAGSQRVCQGISGMTFLDDGSLVVSANAPKLGPKDDGGALWWLRAPTGKAAPELLHHFPRLKPEGVTVSANGRTLAVVFDRDRGEPLWTEVPIPIGTVGSAPKVSDSDRASRSASPLTR